MVCSGVYVVDGVQLANTTSSVCVIVACDCRGKGNFLLSACWQLKVSSTSVMELVIAM